MCREITVSCAGKAGHRSAGGRSSRRRGLVIKALEDVAWAAGKPRRRRRSCAGVVTNPKHHHSAQRRQATTRGLTRGRFADSAWCGEACFVFAGEKQGRLIGRGPEVVREVRERRAGLVSAGESVRTEE